MLTKITKIVGMQNTWSRGMDMYEEPNLDVIRLPQEEFVRTSGESDWHDENVDNNGWT